VTLLFDGQTFILTQDLMGPDPNDEIPQIRARARTCALFFSEPKCRHSTFQVFVMILYEIFQLLRRVAVIKPLRFRNGNRLTLEVVNL
jgi:hypothetical protein